MELTDSYIGGVGFEYAVVIDGRGALIRNNLFSCYAILSIGWSDNFTNTAPTEVLPYGARGYIIDNNRCHSISLIVNVDASNSDTYIRGLKITNNVCDNSGRLIYSTENVHLFAAEISNNIVDLAERQHIEINGTLESSQISCNNLCTFENAVNATDAIVIKNGINVNIVSNVISKPQRSIFVIDDIWNVNIVGNVISDFGVNSPNDRAVVKCTKCRRLLLNGNTIKGGTNGSRKVVIFVAAADLTLSTKIYAINNVFAEDDFASGLTTTQKDTLDNNNIPYRIDTSIS
jgi:hypothetical protein